MINSRAVASETSPRTLLFRHALAAAFKARRQNMPPPPAGIEGLFETVATGLPGLLGRTGIKTTLLEIRARVFQVPGREAEADACWQESLAAAVFATGVAQLRQSSLAASFGGGLLHRAGEALALRMLGRVELEHRVRMDSASRRDWCTTHEYELAERLLRAWAVPTDVASCTLGWRKFGEFAELPGEGTALYFGRVLALEMLHPDNCVPGALEYTASQLGFDGEALGRLRAGASQARELLQALR